MKAVKLMFIMIMMTAVAVSCGNSGEKNDNSKPVIALSILPQKYFLENIGGGRVTALVLVGEGQNPHSYDPTPKQMVSLSTAAAWILSGTDFEISLKPKIAVQYPELMIIDGTDGVQFRYLEEHHHKSKIEKHDDHESKNGINIDRHTWLGQKPAKIMAGHIRDVLIKIDPAGSGVYNSNYKNLINDIDSVFNNLKKSLKSFRGKTVLVFHPSFGYFLDEFGIRQEAVETGGKEPNAKALSELIKKVKSEKRDVIFVQSQFSSTAAETIAEAAGAEVVMLDPLAQNWFQNINLMGAALEKALVKKK